MIASDLIGYDMSAPWPVGAPFHFRQDVAMRASLLDQAQSRDPIEWVTASNAAIEEICDVKVCDAHATDSIRPGQIIDVHFAFAAERLRSDRSRVVRQDDLGRRELTTLIE